MEAEISDMEIRKRVTVGIKTAANGSPYITVVVHDDDGERAMKDAVDYYNIMTAKYQETKEPTLKLTKKGIREASENVEWAKSKEAQLSKVGE